MKISLALLRVDMPDGPLYRFAAYKHYESGHGNAMIDPRALAAAQFGTIAQNVHVLLEWKPFDFEHRGGMIIDPAILAEAMAADSDMVSGAVDAARSFAASWLAFNRPYASKRADPIPDGEQGPERP